MSLRSFLFLAIVVSVYLPAASLSQQTPPGESREPSGARRDSVYHFDAGSSSVKEIAGEQVLEGRDGVHIVHGDVTITAARALHYRRKRQTYLLDNVKIDQKELHMEGDEGEYSGIEDKAILRGRVKIQDRGVGIRCDEAIFYRTTGRAWAMGNVEVVDSSTTLNADSLYYDRQILVSEAFGDVRIVDTKEGIRIRGKHGYYYRNQGKAVIDAVPRLTVDPESDEPTTVDSDTMVFYPDRRVAIAQGRVKIIKGNTVTQCDSAVVTDKSQQVELFGNPLAKQGNVSMQGNLMTLHYDKEKVNAINITGQAMIKETPRDSLVIGRDSWVKGDSMVLFLRENALDSIRVSGRAESEYYPQSPTRVEGNYAKGDSMFFLFKDDSISYVKMVGKANGVYRYINLRSGETGDSLRAQRDTSLTYVPYPEKAERVEYAGDTIQYYARRRDLVLAKNAKVDYRGKSLIGRNITYSANLELLDASGSPVLIEGPDKLHGYQMDYDLDTGTGLVEDGTTKFMDGYYDGKTIAKVGDDVLKVWNSTYTTCDLKVPHYHISSNRMKVYLDDKVVTGPVVLYIGETPIFALPFFAQNIRRGRRSGILRPVIEFGINSSKERFIRNVGYYWATNDYTDFTFVGDFNENRSIRGRIENRYKLRYSFEGGADFSWFRDFTNYTNEWTFSSRHGQTLGEKASFSADLRFVSSDKAPQAVNNLDDVQDVVDRRIESKVSLRKSWNSVGFSASARRTQILAVADSNSVKVSQEFPSITLSIPSRSLYFGKESKKGYESIWEKVFGAVRVSPGLSGNRKTDERLYDRTETITTNGSLGVSAPFKLGFMSVSPQVSASDQYKRVSYNAWDHVVIDDSTTPPDTTLVKGRQAVTSDNTLNLSSGVSANSNVYGTFYASVGALRGIRHTISPSATYSYTPSIQGRQANSRVSLSLRNAIDLKVAKSADAAAKAEGDTTGTEAGGEKEEKTTKLSGVLLWSLNTSLGLDQRTQEYTWSRITSLVNLRVLGTNLSLNQTIDPYQLNVLNTSLSSSVSFRGTHPFGNAAEEAPRELNVAAADTLEGAVGVDHGGEPEKETEKEAEKEGLPWDLALAFSYSKATGANQSSSTLNLGGSIELTRGWEISYRSTYNVIDRDFLGDYFSLTRDLHCWQMSFSRQKLGDEWEFYFKINIKLHPEIYGEQGSRGLGGGTFTSPLGY